jgi:hypothetical protein
VVRAENGAPIPGALVLVGGKQAKTNPQGVFVIANVPLGRQILEVRAGGFLQHKLALDFASGEIEKVALTLRRPVVAPPAQAPR